MPTNAEILSYAPGAGYLAANAVRKGNLFNKGKLNPLLPQQIYALYFIIKKIYDLDPDYTGMTAACNYLWEIMGRYGIAAQGVTGGGGSVTPVTPSGILIPSPIAVRGDDFTSALSWTGANGASVNVLSTYTLQVFYNPASVYLTESTDWTRTATGFDIVLGGVFSSFDATGANASDLFYVFISP